MVAVSGRMVLQMALHPCGVAERQDVGGDVTGDDRSTADHTVGTDGDRLVPRCRKTSIGVPAMVPSTICRHFDLATTSVLREALDLDDDAPARRDGQGIDIGGIERI